MTQSTRNEGHVPGVTGGEVDKNVDNTVGGNLADEAASVATSSVSTARNDADIYPEKETLDTANNNSISPDKNAIRAPSPTPGDPEPAPELGPDAVPPPGDAPKSPEDSRTSLETALIITALASALFLAALDVTIVTVAVPTIAEQFNSTAGYTWIGSAYLLANAAAAPVWGKISDIWGRKPILICAVAVFWVGSLLSAVSVNMSMLIASRAVQGIGGGGIVILVNICISDLFSMRRRGVYFGVMGMVWALAGGVVCVLLTGLGWVCTKRDYRALSLEVSSRRRSPGGGASTSTCRFPGWGCSSSHSS